jgi:hypothetical protein
MKMAIANSMAARASEASPAILPTAPTTPPMMPAVPLPARPAPTNHRNRAWPRYTGKQESCPLQRTESREAAVERRK